jgi:uncharacterized protein (DUF1778 family)
MAGTKDSRLHVRLSSEQDALIRHAAEVEGKTVTDFTVQATVEHARDVLADRRLFRLDDAAWDEFQALLDRPVARKPRLAKLLAKEPPWEG